MRHAPRDSRSGSRWSGRRSEFDVEATAEKAVGYNEIVRDSVDVGDLGIDLWMDQAVRDLTLTESVAAGWHRTGSWTVEIFSFLKRLVTGRGSTKELGGPIVIGQLSGAAARQGLAAFLNFMAIISVNLAVLNLLPIPVLDGGHLVFLFAEAVRGGRPVSAEKPAAVDPGRHDPGDGPDGAGVRQRHHASGGDLIRVPVETSGRSSRTAGAAVRRFGPCPRGPPRRIEARAVLAGDVHDTPVPLRASLLLAASHRGVGSLHSSLR